MQVRLEIPSFRGSPSLIIGGTSNSVPSLLVRFVMFFQVEVLAIHQMTARFDPFHDSPPLPLEELLLHREPANEQGHWEPV